MKSEPRRRPGQRAIASVVPVGVAYDLTKDRRVRARARFENISLGQAIIKYPIKTFVDKISSYNYLARDKIELIENNRLSSREIEIFHRIKNFNNENSDLSDTNPDLHIIIRNCVTLGLNSELAKAKRARHIGNVIKYVDAMCCEPTYQIMDIALLEDVPY